MPIYQKGTSTFTKVKDLYLCKGASDFARICKVYICTGANTFTLVYDGCAVPCDCATYCEFCDTDDSYKCIWHETQKSTFGVQYDCNCIANGEPGFGEIYSCANPPCTFTQGCYYNKSESCGFGLFNTCWTSCCETPPENCPGWANLADGEQCCAKDNSSGTLECP